jgi:hypothetical protein
MNTQETILLGGLGGIVCLYGLYKILSPSDDDDMSQSEKDDITSRPRFGSDGQYIDYSGRGITKRKRKNHKKSHKKRK